VVTASKQSRLETRSRACNEKPELSSSAVTSLDRVSIEVYTASFRPVRGHSITSAILDEVAFWRTDESANPDAEIVNAIKPG
jgi:hypothetical protein